MINVQRIRTPFELSCPHCDAPIIIVEEHARWMVEHDAWLDDGDVIPGIFEALPVEQQEAHNFYCHLGVGSRPCCGEQYVVITVSLVDGDPDDEFRNTYFWHNAECGQPTNYAVTTEEHSWLLTCYESPLGPVYEHTIGPFAWRDRRWIGASGVAACAVADRSPWSFARDLVLAMWDELRRAGALVGSCRATEPS